MALSEETVLRFREGNPEAFETIYQAESLRLSRFILRYVRSRDGAEDIFQEVWVRVWNNRDRLRQPDRFVSWLYQIARHCIYEQTRRRNRKTEIRVFAELTDPDRTERQSENIADVRPGPDRQAQSAEWAAIIERETGRLDEQSREMLALRFGAGLGLREIAETLDLPLGTVCSKVSRSLKTLRRNLEAQGVDWK